MKKKLGNKWNSRHYRFKRFVRHTYAAFNSMHKVVSIGVITGAMLTFAHATATSAQPEQPFAARDSIPEQELDEVVISSLRAGLSLGQAGQLVTIITSREIERQPVQSIQDLLKQVVGLDVRQRGSNGVLAGVSVRGGTFEQTAILLDGANLSNPQTAHYSLDLPVNLSDIERIEVIEGPSSILFGASAFSGGVNIITKTDEENSIYAQVQGGMYESGGMEARATLKTGSASHSLSLGYNRSSGYRDNTDYNLISSLWQSRWEKGKNSLGFQLGINDKSYGATTFYSAAYPNQYDDTRRLFASLRWISEGKLKFMPRIYWSRHYDTFHLFRPGTNDIPVWYTDPNYHVTDVSGLNLNSSYRWDWGGVTNFGTEIRNERIKSSVLGKPVEDARDKYAFSDNRTHISFYAEQTIILGNLGLSAGLLANYCTSLHEGFSFYPNVNASYWVTDRLKAFASWQTATRMPTFTDLYYKGATHKGNSDVKPENSSSFEVGVKYRSPCFSVQLAGFYFKGNNMIDWVKEQPGDLWESRNLTHVNKLGFEIHTSFNFFSSQLNINYMYMYQDKDASGLISNYVLDYLKHKLTIGLSHPIGNKLTADWQFGWQSREGSYTRYENNMVAEETLYPAFALVDIKLNYKLDNVNLFLSVNNLLNTFYYNIGNVPQPGMWMMGGMAIKLKSLI